MGVFRNGGGLGTGESYILVVFFDPLLHRSPCFSDVDFAATGSLLGVVRAFVIFCTNDEGYPLETSTDG